MDLLKKNPLSEKQFFEWFWNKYQQPPIIFERAPYVHQCEAIWRFLGYPVNAPDEWTIQQCIDFTENVLYIYESLLIKYPEGPPDELRNFRDMNYTERKVKYPMLETPRNILHSLNEAIIELDRYEIKTKPLPGLSEAIVMLKKIIQLPLVEDNFWDSVLPKNRKNETVPF